MRRRAVLQIAAAMLAVPGWGHAQRKNVFRLG
jgi:hypothetical protein